jgi:hypothetical protein
MEAEMLDGNGTDGVSKGFIIAMVLVSLFIGVPICSGLAVNLLDADPGVRSSEWHQRQRESGPQPEKEGRETTSSEEANPREAWYMCQEAVREDIHQPSTAEFAPITQVKGGAGVSGDGHWVVTGWVTAQNKVGSQTRGQATCELEWTGSDFEVLRAGIQR